MYLLLLHTKLMSATPYIWAVHPQFNVHNIYVLANSKLYRWHQCSKRHLVQQSLGWSTAPPDFRD